MDENMQNSLLDTLKQAWSQEESFRRVDYFEGETPPSKAPHINELVGAGRALVRGRIQADDYRRVVDTTKERLEESLKVFNAYLAAGSLPDEVQHEADRAVKAFADQRAAIDELERYFADGNFSHIEQGNEMTMSAAATLIAAYEAFGALVLEYIKIPCVQCGHRNPPEFKYCEKCRQDLSIGREQESQAGPAQPVIDIPPGFAMMGQAVEGVKSGVLPVEQFAQFTVQFRALLEQNLPQMDSIINKDMFNIQGEVVGQELFVEFQELAVGMKESILSAMAGLTEIEQFADSQDPSSLDTGWAQMLESGKQMLIISNTMGALMERTKEIMTAEAPEGEAASALDVEEKVELAGESEEA